MKFGVLGPILTLVIFSSNGAFAGESCFQSRWEKGLNRSWIGPDYFANRLQDWRVRNGRVECLEGSQRFPIRTLHLLTRSVGPHSGTLSMSVTTGLVTNGPCADDGWTGFLVGAGGEHVDYRLTAMVHHKPAEDGGILAVMDASGRVGFFDNSRPQGKGGGSQWSVGGGISPKDVPELSGEEREGSGFSGDWPTSVRLVLTAEPEEDGYRLNLGAHDPRSGDLISQATVSVHASSVDGGIGLVSHRGSKKGSGGFWFENWTVDGTKVSVQQERQFGPVLCAQHTLSGGVLKMTAQMGPLGPSDTQTAELQVQSGSEWKTLSEATIRRPSSTFLFRVENWDASRAVRYRIKYDLLLRSDERVPSYYEGEIRREPLEKDDFVVAAFTGHKVFTGGLRWNHSGVWFPHGELVRAVSKHRPDFLFFSGDQIYEGDLTPAQTRPEDKAIQDYLYKWYRWCWAFRDLARNIPCVCIPDDHDVYHGNLWGAGGRAAQRRPGVTAQDSGGYKMGPRFVNMVHETQTSHLPDPVDPRPVDQGISVYYTRIEYAGMSFAVLGDRQWKSSATISVPDGKVVNGWFQAPDFDPVTQADVEGAVLLGQRQLDFLEDWAADWSEGAWMKVVLSQTIFANVATLPSGAKSGSVLPGLRYPEPEEYPEDQQLAADTDSNGWPQTGRNKALKAMRRGFALHIAGDQHLGSTIQYGTDDWEDAGFAMCVPSIANTWPRRWFPSKGGGGRRPGAPKYTGQFLDGFGNRMTVHAVSNPVVAGKAPANLYDRAPGYGIIRFGRKTREIVMECWPRWIDPGEPGASQYRGWPVKVHQDQNYSPHPVGWLPRIEVEGLSNPVFQVINDRGEIVYTLRIAGSDYHPAVFEEGVYSLRIGDPDGPSQRVLSGLIASESKEGSETVVISFAR